MAGTKESPLWRNRTTRSSRISPRQAQLNNRVDNRDDFPFDFYNGGALYIPRRAPPAEVLSALPEPGASTAIMPVLANSSSIGSNTERTGRNIEEFENDSTEPDRISSNTSEELYRPDGTYPYPPLDASEEDESSTESSKDRNDDDWVTEESDQFSVADGDNQGHQNAGKSTSDTNEKLSGSDEPYQSSDEEEDSDDASSQAYSDHNDSLLETSKKNSKRKYQEESSDEEASDTKTRPSKQARTAQANIDKWDRHLEELIKFKESHGHCQVPFSAGPLYYWLNKQRKRDLNPNHSGYLQDIAERERRTKELNSVLATAKDPAYFSWDQRLEELKKFKSTHGHCNVPTSGKGVRALHNWLRNQQTTTLNPTSSGRLRDDDERKRRAKELQSVLGEDLQSWRHTEVRLHDVTRWDQRLKELIKFKATHGHCRVPLASSLYYWIGDQRVERLNPNHSKCIQDVAERTRRTTELESVLGHKLDDKSARQFDGRGWDQHLEELRSFKATHGHCRVPTSVQSLYQWLDGQRTKFLNPDHSKCLPNLAERKRRTKELESVLGIDLTSWRHKCSSRLASKWDQRLEELRKFKATHGHCRVPESVNKPLFYWLGGQRCKFLNPNHSEGLKDVVERERRTKELESVLGIDLDSWRDISKNYVDRTGWDRQLEALKGFKATHGHCRVPCSNPSLYNWLLDQRNRRLNPNDKERLQNVPEREWRTKELESVLGAKLQF